jgi:hypothetical protein
MHSNPTDSLTVSSVPRTVNCSNVELMVNGSSIMGTVNEHDYVTFRTFVILILF